MKKQRSRRKMACLPGRFLTIRLSWARNRPSRAQLHGDSKYGRLLCLILITCALAVGCLIFTGRCLSSHRLVAALQFRSLHSNSIATAGLVTELLSYPIGNADLLGYLNYKPARTGSHGTDVLGSLDTTDWFFSWLDMGAYKEYAFLLIHLCTYGRRTCFPSICSFINPIFKGTFRDCLWLKFFPDCNLT